MNQKRLNADQQNNIKPQRKFNLSFIPLRYHKTIHRIVIVLLNIDNSFHHPFTRNINLIIVSLIPLFVH